jgi:hypothetical protein
LFVLTVVGALLSVTLLPEWRANHTYVEGRCVVLDKRVVEVPSRRAANCVYRAEFLIRYTVAGREHERWAYDAVRASTALRWPKERVLDDFIVGQEYPCWYDPADPSKVVMVRGYSWMSCGFLVAFGVLAFLTGKGVLRRLCGATTAMSRPDLSIRQRT